MWRRRGDILIGTCLVRETRTVLFLCVCMHIHVSGVCVRDNPSESLSLKGNRCRFTYVEGPEPVMRLAGRDLSSQQLEGAYLINAWS